MSVKFDCPNCGTSILLTNVGVGEPFQCRACGTRSVVPDNVEVGGGDPGLLAPIPERPVAESAAGGPDVEAEAGAEEEAVEVEVDELALQAFVQELKEQQSLPKAILGGAIAAAVGAGLWAAITAATEIQFGIMAIGVGFLVGYAVREFGKGLDKQFGAAGAVLALLGCVAGNILTVCIFVSQEQSIPLGDLLSQMTPALAWEMLVAFFSPMDFIFYAIAVYQGYRFSFRRITAEETERFTRPKRAASIHGT